MEDIFEIKASSEKWDPKKHSGKLLVIGKEIEKQKLTEYILANGIKAK